MVDKKEVDKFINDNLGLDMTYLETSAVSGFQIELLFKKIFEIAVEKIKIKDTNYGHNMLEMKIIENENEDNNYRCCTIL